MSVQRIEVAEEVLRAAGEMIAQGLFGRIEVRDKALGHWTTSLDAAVHESIVSGIRVRYPEDSILSEESNEICGTSDFLWTIDPIDGTSNLVLGLPYVATALALQWRGETVLSVVYNPILKEMVVAERGCGAFLNGERLHTSGVSNPRIGYYVQGYRVPPPVYLEVMRVLLPKVHRVLNTWAPTLDWCNLARGKTEFIVGYDTELHEFLCGDLIVREAGGAVTAWSGRPLMASAKTQQRITFVASNGAAHEKLRCALDEMSVPAALQGYASDAEKGLLRSVGQGLHAKVCGADSQIAERITRELGLPEVVWSHDADLGYLVEQARSLRTSPESLVRRIFDAVSPRASGEEARQGVLSALQRVADAWQPDKQPLEVAAQAVEIVASDVLLHDAMRAYAFDPSAIADLVASLPQDSLDVGRRLKRNAFRQIRARQGMGEPESLGPMQALAELPRPTTARIRSPEGTAEQFAALIITAGRGTRLRSSVPKALVPLGHRPMLDYTYDALHAAGATDMAVVIGYKHGLHASVMHDMLVLRQDEQLGTAHAVMMAQDCFSAYRGPLVVSYSDMPFVRGETLQAMVSKHCARGALMTILTTSREKHPEFGRVMRRGDGVCGIGQVRFEAVESDEVDAGYYCFKAPDFWDYLGQVRNANNRREFVLTEIVAMLAKDGQRIETHYTDDWVEGLGINRPSERIQAESVLYVAEKLRQRSAHPLHGDAELYWRLRFYEAFGGKRADELFAEDFGGPDAAQRLLEDYDRTLNQEIGAVFRCPISE